MSADILGPLMFVVAFGLIFSGYPVAFSLGGTALIFAAIGVAMDIFDVGLLNAFPQRVFGVMSNAVLLAVPFFIFMGTMLEKSKLAEDLLTTIGMMFGRLRGGLALAVVFVGALLAAATGVVGASVVAMGMISMPVMLRYGYSKTLSAGVITAAGTLGQIIPPSVVLVVLADQLSVSVGDLFKGALLPGLMLAGMYAAYVVGVAILSPRSAPALPPEVLPASRRELAGKIVWVMLPPLALIGLVLGSIFAGIATPTATWTNNEQGRWNRQLSKIASHTIELLKVAVEKGHIGAHVTLADKISKIDNRQKRESKELLVKAIDLFMCYWCLKRETELTQKTQKTNKHTQTQIKQTTYKQHHLSKTICLR